METVLCADRASSAGRTAVALWHSVPELENLSFDAKLLAGFVRYRLALLEKNVLKLKMPVG